MSEQEPEEFNKLVDLREPNVIEHGEEKSIQGSGQTIGLEPGENFIAPTMALDSLDQEPNE